MSEDNKPRGPVNGRWTPGGIRHSPARKVEDGRWQRVKGQWRRVIDETDESTYCERRREQSGFRRGARVHRK